jgi:ring-1,2-phenylacetyl-CoA epoxidase subunit PaaD
MLQKLSQELVYEYLQNVFDPEVPVLTVLDLGVVRDVIIDQQNRVEVVITPTYSGCPAMDVIATNIKFELISRGITHVKTSLILSPAWTTDWISKSGREKLKQYGIAPPQYAVANNSLNTKVVPCPICDSNDTKVISEFASTACKSMYKCNTCLEAFDYFKCH